MFAYQMYHVMPDVMLCAKALGCGVPVGAFVCNDRAASMTYGDHGTTYGGNPFVCTAVSEVFDIFKEENIVEHVKEVGTYLWDRLEEMKEKYDCIVDHRGKGLIQGLEFTFAPKDFVSKCLNAGLIVIAAENNTVRFVPPLVISNEDIDRMISILSMTIKGN